MYVIRIPIQCFRFCAGKIGKGKIYWTCLVQDNNSALLCHWVCLDLAWQRTKDKDYLCTYAEVNLEGEKIRSQATLDDEEEQTRKVIQEVSCDINFTFLSHYYSPGRSPGLWIGYSIYICVHSAGKEVARKSKEIIYGPCCIWLRKFSFLVFVQQENSSKGFLFAPSLLVTYRIYCHGQLEYVYSN